MTDMQSKKSVRIVNVESDGIADKVYDIEVNNYHNFAIGKDSVVVHNSGIHTMPAGSSTKKFFTSRFRGGILLTPDFSANELRCVASYAQEENMLKAFAEGKDIHKANAAMMYEIPYDEVTKYQRRFAKTMCLDGETKVRLLSGKSKTLKELYEEFSRGELNDWVYSYCHDNGEIIPCKILSANCERVEDQYVEITLDNGAVLKSTLDHKFMLRDGTSIQAKDLKPDDSLMSIYFSYTDKNNRFNLTEGYELFKGSLDSDWNVTHRQVARFVDIEESSSSSDCSSKSFAIHHIDFDKNNNTPTNLMRVPVTDHFKIHAQSKKKIIESSLDDYIESNPELTLKIRNYNSENHVTIQEYLAELLVEMFPDRRNLGKFVRNQSPELLDIIMTLTNDSSFLESLDKALDKSNCRVLKRLGNFKDHSDDLPVWSGDRRKVYSDRAKAGKLFIIGLQALVRKHMKNLIDHNLEVNQENFNKYRPVSTMLRYENIEQYTGVSPEQLLMEAKALPFQNMELVAYDRNALSLRSSVQLKNLWNDQSERGYRFREQHSIKQSKIMTHLNKSSEVKLIQRRNKVLKYVNRMLSDGVNEEDIRYNFLNTFKAYKKQQGISSHISICTNTEKLIRLFGSLDKMIEDARTFNHRVKSVRIVNDPCHKFYCILVNNCHNFAIDLGDNSSVLTNQSFSLIYGSSALSMAQTYFNGDVQKAEAAIKKFYETFPKLKIWMEQKHNEALSTHKVSVLTHRFLKMEYNKNDKKDIAKMLRIAVNGPVQSYHKDTKIRGLDGSDYKIGYLADNNLDLWTFAYDIENHMVVPVKGINAQCTGTTDTWYKITLDNNEVVQVTPEHLMMLDTGQYVRADELNVGDSLKPVSFSKLRNRVITNDGNWLIDQRVLRECYPYLNFNMKDVIHHINLNTNDNSPENLVKIDFHLRKCYFRLLKDFISCNDDIGSARFQTQTILEKFVQLLLKSEYHLDDAERLFQAFKQFHDSCVAKKTNITSEPILSENDDANIRIVGRVVKSIDVIHLDTPEPKYDLHIPVYQNFALSAGVFSHNSAASSVAAIVFCDVIQFMRSKNMKSKPICFIHDSLETDLFPYELLEVIEYQQDKLANGAMDYFGLALKADVSMGVNMGEDVEMESIEIIDEAKTKGYLELKGYKDEVENLIETWKLAYYKVDIVEEEWTPEFISMSQYYIPRKAFDPSILTTRESGKCKVYIQYYTDEGNIDPINKGNPQLHGTWDNFPLFDYFGKD